MVKREREGKENEYLNRRVVDLCRDNRRERERRGRKSWRRKHR